MYKVLLGIAITCMLVQLGESGTNCNVGNCPCNKKTINVNKPGLAVNNLNVCCPPSDSIQCSKYVRAGSATASDGAFCNCDFVRVAGSCLRGEQCTDKNKTEQINLNGMPICCQEDSDKLSVKAVNSGGQTTYECECAAPAPAAPWTGSCWQGSQCNSCDPGFVGGVNGLKLCCANCEKKGLIINAGNRTCDCNN